MKPGLILFLLGLVGLFAFTALAVFGALLPVITDGKIDIDEPPAFLSLFGGGCCSSLSLMLTVGGLIWWLMAKDNRPASHAPPHRGPS